MTDIYFVKPLGYQIKFQLPFNNIKWLSDYSRRWQVKGVTHISNPVVMRLFQQGCPCLKLCILCMYYTT